MADLLNYLENVLYAQRLEACLELLQDVRRRLNLYAPADKHRLQRGETDFFSGEPLAALSTLVYSQNIDLQRSASLTFAEITERGMFAEGKLHAESSRLTAWETDVRPVDRATLEPILYLLESPDIEVQRAASAALGNLAVDGTTHPREPAAISLEY